MDLFLQKHLLLCNKNNILEIKLGRKKSNKIFDGNLNTSMVKKIIEKIKSTQNFKVRTVNYIDEVFIKNNESFTLNNGELTYQISNVNDYYLDSTFLIKSISITRDEFIIPTYNNYDNIETTEILDIKINNLLTVRVKNLNTSHSLSILISKPIKMDLLKTVLDKLQ